MLGIMQKKFKLAKAKLEKERICTSETPSFLLQLNEMLTDVKVRQRTKKIIVMSRTKTPLKTHPPEFFS